MDELGSACHARTHNFAVTAACVVRKEAGGCKFVDHYRIVVRKTLSATQFRVQLALEKSQEAASCDAQGSSCVCITDPLPRAMPHMLGPPQRSQTPPAARRWPVDGAMRLGRDVKLTVAFRCAFPRAIATTTATSHLSQKGHHEGGWRSTLTPKRTLSGTL